MQYSKLELKLLKKLNSKELDGILPGKIEWKSQNCICRKMIMEGIPCFISIDIGPLRCYPKVILEQYYETDEMKLWFLKYHGSDMTDPDVVAYSHLQMESEDSLPAENTGSVI